MTIKPLKLKQNDLQPYYPFRIRDANKELVDLTGATIYCTMKSTSGTIKINKQTTGVNILDQTAYKGQGYYAWINGDTDTVGKYLIEFEIVPANGGKFTMPVDDDAVVIIRNSLDTT